MAQISSIVGGAMMPCLLEAAANPASVYTGFASPVTSAQWRIIARLTSSWPRRGGPVSRPT